MTTPIATEDLVNKKDEETQKITIEGERTNVVQIRNITVKEDIENPDHKLTKEDAIELRESEQEYKEALAYVKDMIAPSMIRIDATKLQIGDTYVRTIFTYAYPDVLE